MKIVNVQTFVTHIFQVVDGEDVIPETDAQGQLRPLRQAQFYIPSITPEAFHGAFCQVAGFREEQLEALRKQMMGRALMTNGAAPSQEEAEEEK